MIALRSVLVSLMLLLMPCCGYGLIYTHTVKPLDLNQQRTEIARTAKKGDIRHLQFRVGVSWSSNAIGDIAKKNGIETIHYADMELLSVLGIWRQYTVHVYGTTENQVK